MKEKFIPLEQLTRHFNKENVFTMDCYAPSSSEKQVGKFFKDLEDLMYRYKICSVDARIHPKL